VRAQYRLLTDHFAGVKHLKALFIVQSLAACMPGCGANLSSSRLLLMYWLPMGSQHVRQGVGDPQLGSAPHAGRRDQGGRSDLTTGKLPGKDPADLDLPQPSSAVFISLATAGPVPQSFFFFRRASNACRWPTSLSSQRLAEKFLPPPTITIIHPTSPPMTAARDMPHPPGLERSMRACWRSTCGRRRAYPRFGSEIVAREIKP